MVAYLLLHTGHENQRNASIAKFIIFSLRARFIRKLAWKLTGAGTFIEFISVQSCTFGLKEKLFFYTTLDVNNTK